MLATLLLLTPALALTIRPQAAPELCLQQSGEPGSAPLTLAACKDAGGWRRDESAYKWAQDELWCLGAGLSQSTPCSTDSRTDAPLSRLRGARWRQGRAVRLQHRGYSLVPRKHRAGARVRLRVLPRGGGGEV
jgi:hypothetical protein